MHNRFTSSTGRSETERDQKGKRIEEIGSEKFPNLEKETDIQEQEAQRVPDKMNSNRLMKRHIIIKMTRVKERLLRATRGKQRVSCKGISIRLSANFSTKTADQRAYHDIFKVLKGENLQLQVIYTRLSLRIRGLIKKLLRQEKLRDSAILH